MCGAPDCPYCYPQNFSTIAGRSIFVAEMTPEELEETKNRLEAQNGKG
jgi:sulfatase maturation enzyme AslB (radical SAM superfamily)